MERASSAKRAAEADLAKLTRAAADARAAAAAANASLQAAKAEVRVFLCFYVCLLVNDEECRN